MIILLVPIIYIYRRRNLFRKKAISLHTRSNDDENELASCRRVVDLDVKFSFLPQKESKKIVQVMLILYSIAAVFTWILLPSELFFGGIVFGTIMISLTMAAASMKKIESVAVLFWATICTIYLLINYGSSTINRMEVLGRHGIMWNTIGKTSIYVAFAWNTICELSFVCCLRPLLRMVEKLTTPSSDGTDLGSAFGALVQKLNDVFLVPLLSIVYLTLSPGGIALMVRIIFNISIVFLAFYTLIKVMDILQRKGYNITILEKIKGNKTLLRIVIAFFVPLLVLLMLIILFLACCASVFIESFALVGNDTTYPRGKSLKRGLMRMINMVKIIDFNDHMYVNVYETFVLLLERHFLTFILDCKRFKEKMLRELETSNDLGDAIAWYNGYKHKIKHVSEVFLQECTKINTNTCMFSTDEHAGDTPTTPDTIFPFFKKLGIIASCLKEVAEQYIEDFFPSIPESVVQCIQRQKSDDPDRKDIKSLMQLILTRDEFFKEPDITNGENPVFMCIKKTEHTKKCNFIISKGDIDLKSSWSDESLIKAFLSKIQCPQGNVSAYDKYISICWNDIKEECKDLSRNAFYMNEFAFKGNLFTYLVYLVLMLLGVAVIGAAVPILYNQQLAIFCYCVILTLVFLFTQTSLLFTSHID